MLEPRELILALVDQFGANSRFGRTSMQKAAYLTGAALGWRNLGHTAYFYGPYSRLLDSETNRLVREGLIEEHSEDLRFVGTAGFPARQFRYELSAEGCREVERIRTIAPKDMELVSAFVDRLSAVTGMEQRVLSLMAKTHFISSGKETPLSDQEIRGIARELGWKIPFPEVSAIRERLAKLKL